MSTLLRTPLTTRSWLRPLSIALIAVAASGCAISVHSSTSGGTTPDKTKPKDDKPSKPSKPAEEKPKPSKPKPTTPSKPKPKPTDPKPTDPKPVDPKPTDPKPVDPKPVDPKPEAPKPAPEISRVVVPVRIPFETAIAKIDSLLPKTDSRDWQRVTKKGDSPEADIKYKVWRDPIQASFSKDTLRVVVPLRYAATIRVKAKNPVGGDWIWLTKGETWGTSSKPQRAKVTVDLQLSIDGNWKVKSVSKLQSIKHGEAPSGNFCARVGIDICTPKENLAPRVEGEINDYLVPKIESALAKADTEIEKALDVKKSATALWAAIQTPQQLQKVSDKDCPTQGGGTCKKAAWLVVVPSSMGMSQITLSGDDLGVDLSLEGKVSTVFGARPKVKAKEFPKLTPPASPTEFQIRTALELPLDALEDLVGAELKKDGLGGSGSAKLQVKSVSIKAEGKDSTKKLTLTITTDGAYDGKIVVVGQLDYDAKKGILSLEKLEFDAATKALFSKELKSFDAAAIEKRVVASARWDLSKESSQLRKALTASLNDVLPGKLELKGELKELSIIDAKIEDGVIVARIELSGKLGVDFTPL